jgi:hypothetical protein
VKSEYLHKFGYVKPHIIWTGLQWLCFYYTSPHSTRVVAFGGTPSAALTLLVARAGGTL